ncbi:unnamed protein product [Sphenostylis stenocarpa]|uniref:Epidermal patterning factor-like protein n=1 Tax=Sphenostylis stenocarpa TaxID=92480 RepID=A0AA86W5A5_9FABA|nr:unnamed protein product [Sphenostylis stenocarpa]
MQHNIEVQEDSVQNKNPCEQFEAMKLDQPLSCDLYHNTLVLVPSLKDHHLHCILLHLDPITAMSVSPRVATFLFACIFAAQIAIGIANDDDHDNDVDLKHSSKIGDAGRKRGRTVEIAGSRFPDCMHACGSCSPCRLVTVSFACASLTDQCESCPISYRCMCNTKSYPIP